MEVETERKADWYKVLQKTETRKKIRFIDFFFLKKGLLLLSAILSLPFANVVSSYLELNFWLIYPATILLAMFLFYYKSNEVFLKKEETFLAKLTMQIYRLTIGKKRNKRLKINQL